MKKLLKKSCCIILTLSLIMSVPVYSFADTELTSTRGVEMSAMASKSKPSKPIITVKPVNNDIGLEDYYMDEYCIGFIYRGGSIIKAGYEATEIIDLYSDLLQEYGFDYHGMTLVDGTFLYFFSRNYLDDDVTILYDSHGITIEIGNC